jgi:hypothetical protein
LKKLPGFAGNTNVIDITEKSGTKAAWSRLEKGRRGEKMRQFDWAD